MIRVLSVLVLTSLSFSFSFGQTLDPIEVKSYGGIGIDEVTASIIDSQGNLYIGGFTTKGFTMDSFSIDHSPSSSEDIFLAKIDLTGNVLWLKKISLSVNWSRVTGITFDQQGNLLLSGLTTITKFTSNGDFVSLIRLYQASILSIVTDLNNNIIITGQYSGTLNFGSFSLTSAHMDYDNVFIAKYNSSGTALWAKSYRDQSVYWNYCRGKAVIVDANNDIYLGGEFESSITLGSYTLTSSNISSDSPFLAKLSGSNGTVQWAKLVATDEEGERVTGLAYHDGVVYVIGSYLKKFAASSGAILGTSIVSNELSDISIDNNGVITVYGQLYFPGVVYPVPPNSNSSDYYPVVAQLKNLDKVDWYHAFHNKGWELPGFGSSRGLNKSFFIQNFDNAFEWKSVYPTAGETDFVIGRFGALPVKSHFTLNNTPCDKEGVNFVDSSYINFGASVISSWSWDFGDQTTSTSQNPSHVFPSPGNYTITLTIQDNLGNSNSYSKKIYVAPGASPLTVQDTYALGGMNFSLRPKNTWGITQWYKHQNDLTPFYEGEYLDVTLNKDTTFYVRNKSYEKCYTQPKALRVIIGPPVENNLSRVIKTKGIWNPIMKRDAQDNLYVVFSFDASASDGTVSLDKKGTTSFLFTKLKPDGTVLWMNQIYSNDYLYIADLAVRTDNKLVFGGHFESSVTMDESTLTIANPHNSEVVIGLINAETGAIEKMNRFGDLYTDWMTPGSPHRLIGLEVDTDNNVYFTGTECYRPNSNSEFWCASFGNYSFVGKLDPQLDNYLWAKHVYVDPTNTGNRINGWKFIVKTPTRLVVGNDLYESSSYHTPMVGYIDAATGGSGIGPIYRKNTGHLESMDQDRFGNVFLILEKVPTIDATFGNGTANMDGAGAYLVKMDQNANFYWAKRIGDHQYFGTRCRIDFIDNDGNVYVTGLGDDLDFEQTRPQLNKKYVAKYSNNGNILWVGYLPQISADAQRVALSNGDVVSLSLEEDVTVNNTYEAGYRSLFITRSVQNELKVTHVDHVESICKGEAVAFDASVFSLPTAPITSWKWSFGDNETSTEVSPLHTYSTDGVYEVTLKVTNSQNKTSSFTSSITVNPLPDQTISISGGELTVPEVAGNQYQWFKDGVKLTTAANNAIQPTQSGHYSVEVTSASGCKALSEEVEFVITLAESEVRESNIDVYPNPSKQIITVSINNITHEQRVGLYNVSGDLLGKEIIDVLNPTCTFTLEHLPKGVYFIKIYGKDIIIKKVVKL